MPVQGRLTYFVSTIGIKFRHSFGHLTNKIGQILTGGIQRSIPVQKRLKFL